MIKSAFFYVSNQTLDNNNDKNNSSLEAPLWK